MMIPFFKLHGLGNDFVLIDEMDDDRNPLKITKALLQKFSNRKTGIGFDQFLLLKSSTRVHARLYIFNADGSRAEMCGNGLRAAALYLWQKRHLKARELVIETDTGDRRSTQLTGRIIECEMGVPKILKTPKVFEKGIRLGGKTHFIVSVDSGVPHAVVFAQPKDEKQLTEWGRFIENHKAFPKKTNVDFAQVLSSHQIEVQMWERGVGVTEACGTGAIAVVAAAMQLKVKSPVEVIFAGGQAEVIWESQKSPAYLRGTAELVYEGKWLAE